MRKIKVFVGSPGDVPQERDIVSAVVGELSRTIATIISVELETIRWETHAWPDIGDDAQDVINREIGDFDVFVGIMWRRFGTPTKRAKSGTGEEFERAYRYFKNYQRPKIMFYFRKTPFFSTDMRELRQFSKVIAFRKQLEKYGVLFWDYDEPIDFERRFREHLTKQLLQLQAPTPQPNASRPPKIFLSYKRQDIARVEPVYEAFLAAGFFPWMDVRDILPGGRWIEEVEAAIKGADFFLTFISLNTVDPSIQSETGFSVGSEVVIARKMFDQGVSDEPGSIRPDPRSRFIPVRLDRVEPPASIAKFQWVDLFEPRDLQTLTDAIRRIWKSK
jgi:TIR domain/Domain of unknown function (DUF4062)